MKKETTKEDYLRAIYHLEEEEKRKDVKSIEIAGYLKISKPSVSEMARKLVKGRLIKFGSYEKIILTAKGLKEARKMTHRHRVIEMFLADILKLSPEETHEEAHNLEHAFSDKAISSINKLLKNPRFCPHGKPIPKVE